MMSGVPVTKVGKNELDKLAQMDGKLNGKVIGQEDAVKKLLKLFKGTEPALKTRTVLSELLFSWVRPELVKLSWQR